MSKGNINVRPFENTDTAPLATLMAELGYPTSVEEMSERMAMISKRPDFATFVAEITHEIVGMIGICVAPSYEHNPLSGRIMALIVAKRCQGHGVGGLLVRHSEAWLAGKSVGRIIVNSGLARAGAHSFYRRLGYTQTGLRFVKATDPAVRT